MAVTAMLTLEDFHPPIRQMPILKPTIVHRQGHALRVV